MMCCSLHQWSVMFLIEANLLEGIKVPHLVSGELSVLALNELFKTCFNLFLLTFPHRKLEQLGGN